MTEYLKENHALVYIVCFHQSMPRWGNMEPGNYTPIILLPRNCSLIAQFGTSFKFCSHENVILLVVSTISMVSTVSSQASKHLYSFAHYPHHTRSASIVAYHSNTHCPHPTTNVWCEDFNLKHPPATHCDHLSSDYWSMVPHQNYLHIPHSPFSNKLWLSLGLRIIYNVSSSH